MKKNIKNYSILLSVFLCIFTCINIYPKALPSDVHIVEDSDKTTELPNNFRKTTDLQLAQSLSSLNLTGLDKLNISGSQQFTAFNLPLMIKDINTKLSIIDIDLREESHGFINGYAISFENEKNNANNGLTLEQVIETENKDLASIKLNEPLIFYNNKKEIIPTKVQNELDVAKENNLSYLRIPVTDGGLPNEDMVNYFVDFVKNQPKNTWLHFHCKEGIGRTTTFMIMYDIMKNCKEVSLHDIIGRQVLLSQIQQKEAIDFFIGRRYKFLTDFYNKCKNDKLAYSSTYSINSVSKSANTINSFKENIKSCFNNSILFNSDSSGSYIKNSIIPKELYVISEDNMTKEERTMIATLQGLIANKSNKQIYIISSGQPDYDVWLEDLKNNYNIKCKKINDPWALLDKFKTYVSGYVLYTNSNLPSINNACTLSSLKSSIAIEASLEGKVKDIGICNLIQDCKETDKFWAYNNLWNCGLNHSIVLEISPDKPISLRDYAMISKSLIFYEEDINSSELRDIIFQSMNDNGHCLGWGPDEHTNVSIASKSGVDVIAADWSYNLSSLSSFPLKPLTQKANDTAIEIDGVHYVTFIMSDGDNQQWFLGNNYTQKNWYGSPHRSSFNLGWSISPSLYYLAPTVFKKYYESASNLNFNDDFVVPPSGNGYMYPSQYPIDKLNNYTRTLNEYMQNVDENYVLIIDDDAFHRKDLWDKYTSNSNIDGLFYLEYSRHNKYEGEIIWSNNKPIVSCRNLLWSGLEEENNLIDSINNKILLGYTNIHDPNSYTFVYVHVWSKSMDNVASVINELNQNPRLKVVTPTIFMKLIKQNCSPR